MNKHDDQMSPEFLNAFVDDQLTSDEKAEAYGVINKNASLNKCVCELRKIRDMVQLAYKHPPLPADGMSNGPDNKKRSFFGIAASITLVAGILLGSFVGTQVLRSPAGERVTVNTKTDAAKNTLAAAEEPVRLLVHINSGDNTRLKEALDEIENLMAYYEKTGQAAEVELVANGQGIKLLSKDMSPYPDRVVSLLKRYKNLRFAACQNTLENVTAETGFALTLIPGVTVIDSGVAEIMRRQHQGWAYIQV
ncbi:MAG: DsrE family protein [Gammaproteobacteria bacterium]|nr:DsrE family protein [Gammaproteobacteria bacterium]